MGSTHRLEDERCIVVDRVLPAPLLEQEDDHRNDESNPVALAQERLLRAPRPFRASRSSAIAASISAISARMRWLSGLRRRRYARFAIVSSMQSLDASQRGNSLTVRRPKVIMLADTSWKPNSIRQTAYPVLVWMLIPTARAHQLRLGSSMESHGMHKTHS